MVNASSFAISSMGFTPAAVAGGLDRVVAFLTVALAQGKFYLLFSFLFGYSLSFAFGQADDARQARHFRRRLVALGLIGLAHAVLLYIGDILFLYAVLGVGLLWLRRQSDRMLAGFSAGMGVLWLALLVLLMLPDMAEPQPALEPSFPALTQGLDLAMATGGFFQAAAARLAAWPMLQFSGALLIGPGVLMMFGIGTSAGRRRLLAAPAAHAGCWRAGRRWGLGLGLPLALLAAWLAIGPGARLNTSGMRETFGLVLGLAAAPLLTWGYVAGLVSMRQRWPDLLAPLRPAGRMSLTSYLGESLLMSLLFCGYGAGLYGRLGAAATALVAVAVWLAVGLAAWAWQQRHRQGPVEWLMARWVRRDG